MSSLSPQEKVNLDVFLGSDEPQQIGWRQPPLNRADYQPPLRIEPYRTLRGWEKMGRFQVPPRKMK